MVKFLSIIILLSLLTGCVRDNKLYGLNLDQLQQYVDTPEQKYFQSFQYIFRNYDLTLYEILSIRADKYYYLLSKENTFNQAVYDHEIKPNLLKHGWVLIEQNPYGELYCDKNNHALGITFPVEDQHLDGKNTGFYTYQFYKKVAITFDFNPYKNGRVCIEKSFEVR